MTPTQSKQVGTSSFAGPIVLAILTTAVLVSLHPVSCSDYWWELSKGRAAYAGSWNPSQDLLAGPVGAEGDWGSGLPFYLLFSSIGPNALMWLKIAAAVFAARLLMRTAGRPDLATGLLIVISLIAARQAWEPSPLCFDTIGVLLVLVLTRSMSHRMTAGKILSLLLLLLCCWSNIGARSVVGLLVAVPLLVITESRPVAKLASVALLVTAACLTPAGLMTLVNSWNTTFPMTMESITVLRLAGWSPWWEGIQQIECAAWLVLCGLYCWRGVQGHIGRFILVLVGTQVLAAGSPENLPLAAMIMTCCGMWDGTLSGVKKEVQISGLGRLQTIALLCLMIGFNAWALKPWQRCGAGSGWGLDPSLAPDAFAASVSNVRLVGNAHCVGVREAGLFSWHLSSGIRPYDTPRSALLNGRLRSHLLLTFDLSKIWKTPHRRADGSWGGWWLPLNDRKITTLVIPSESHELITALEPSIWKPLSLNSISLVYGKAGDPGCSHQIVNTISLREFVDRGTWVYQTSSEESSAHTELIDWLSGGNTIYESLRLAQVFRAMKMSVGALKVLAMLPVETHSGLRQEYVKNQLALGYEERVACGRSSRFRLEAWRLMARLSDPADHVAQNVLNWPSEDLKTPETVLAEAIRLYNAGDHTSAIRKLSAHDAETVYAKALVLVESGQTQEADAVLRQFVAEFSDHRLAASAKMLLASLVF